jgi:voltage-gated potassium channel
MIVWAVLRIVGSTAVLVAVYYLLPLTHSSAGAAITILVIGLVVFIGLVAAQVRSIMGHPFPGLRAIEALATSVPLFLLLFASSYVVMAKMSASNFGERLTHTDGLYFTVTVFSTVGFGDITPTSQAARLVVTGQIIADFVILGLAIKVIVGAVNRRRQPADTGGAQPSLQIAASHDKPASHDA